MRYRLLSLCLLTSLYANAKPSIYEDAVISYCSAFSETLPLASCLEKYQKAALEKGVDIILEEIQVKSAIDKAFEDGTFTLEPSATGYRAVETVVSPMVDNSYVENRQHLFYLNPKMTTIQHILFDFRNGLFGGKNGKQIDNEVVRIERISANLKESKESLFIPPSWPLFEYQPLELDGFTLYRYKMQSGASYVTPNYSILPDSKGSDGKWIPSKGHQASQEQSELASSKMDPVLNGDGSFDVQMQFGYEVYLLVKFNSDKSVDLGMPARDNTGRLTMDPNSIRTLILSDPGLPETNAPSKVALKDGWFPNTPTFNVEEYSDWMSRFATTMVGNYPRFVCRFETFNGMSTQRVFGYIEVLYQDKSQTKAICTLGDNVYLETIKGKKEAVVSEINKFERLSLKDTDFTGQKVMAKGTQALCSINSNGFYGVGYVNKNGQCVQDPNIFWSNGKAWTFSKGWQSYYYQ